jgi:glycosyltransferase involved in cell wall biosynthesis
METELKLKICLLLEDYYSPSMPSRPAVTEIYGKYFPELGHKVVWISPSLINKRISYTKYNKALVYTIPFTYTENILVKAYSYLKYYLKEFYLLRRLFKEEPFDIIQVRNNVFNGIIALYFKKKYSIPFAFQYTFPKNFLKMSQLDNRPNYLVYYFMEHINQYIIKNSDVVFPISISMKNKLIDDKVLELKLMPLPMGVNPELFSLKEECSHIKDKYKLENYSVILYVGSLDKLRSLSLIIDSFSKVLTHNFNAKLLIVGDGTDKSNLENLSIKLGIEKNVIFTGQVPYFEIPYFISIADICLSPIPPLEIYKVSSPTKLFEYMSIGKPIVSNKEIPEQMIVLNESGCGLLVEFNSDSFAEGIIKLLRDPKKSKEMGKKGYEWVLKNRSYKNMSLNLEEKYLELLNNRKL